MDVNLDVAKVFDRVWLEALPSKIYILRAYWDIMRLENQFSNQ